LCQEVDPEDVATTLKHSQRAQHAGRVQSSTSVLATCQKEYAIFLSIDICYIYLHWTAWHERSGGRAALTLTAKANLL
jgi:hypothetical protein